MSLSLTLSSTSKEIIGGPENITNSARFTIRTDKFGLYGHKKWEVSCESIDWVNAEYNIDAKYNNNTIFYKIATDAVTVYQVTIPNGRYAISNLSAAFKKEMIAAGHFAVIDGVNVADWHLQGNGSTLRFIFVINKVGTQILFSEDVPFYGVLATQSPIIVTTEGAVTTDLNNGTTGYFLIINSLVRNTFINNNEISWVSHFQPLGKPGSTYKYVRNPRQWFNVNISNRIEIFRVRVVNQQGVQVEMPGGNSNPLTIELKFRPAKLSLKHIV